MTIIEKTANKTRTLIIETNGTGHRFYYVRLILEAALSRGDYVVLGLSKTSATCAEYNMHLKELEKTFSIVFVEPADLRSIEITSKQIRANITIVPDGDKAAFSLALKRKWSGEGKLALLIMRERAQSTRFVRKTFVDLLKKKSFEVTSRVKDVRIVILKSSFWTAASQFPVARDPVSLAATLESIGQIKKQWDIDDSRHWFGIFGGIDQRKNVALVAQSLHALQRSDIGFLIAGKCQTSAIYEAKSYLDDLRGIGVKVKIVDKLLSDTDMDSAIAAVDTAVLAHNNESPSGIMGKAVMAGTDVVASGALALKEDADSIPSNALWCPLGVEELALAFETSLIRAGSVLPMNGLGNKQFTDVLLSTEQ